jgi:hypothetical protein
MIARGTTMLGNEVIANANYAIRSNTEPASIVTEESPQQF